MILTYHKVGRQFELGITTLARRRFAEHLELLAEFKIQLVTASAAVSVSRDLRVAITFDDGYESVYSEALPEMGKRGICGTVFPVVGSVGSHNSWDVRLSPKPFMHLSWPQLEELARLGFEIGSHTLSHRDLTKLDRPSLRRELTASKNEIEDRIGKEVKALAYPFGRVSPLVVEEALKAGYRYGFISCPNLGHDPMIIGRMGVYSMDGRGALRRKLGLLPGQRLERLKSRLIARFSLGTTVVKR